jgi:uncharacterized protein YggE
LRSSGRSSSAGFSQGLYGGQGAAQISFTLAHPDDVDKVLAAAQEAVRKQTNYDLQAANVVFSLSDCPSVELKAWKAALADAAVRAQRLADLSGVKLGQILAVSERATARLQTDCVPEGRSRAAHKPSGAFRDAPWRRVSMLLCARRNHTRQVEGVRCGRVPAH